MNEKKYGAITSSVDPEKISTTVQAAARIVAGLAVFAGFISVADSTTLLQNVNQTLTNVMALIPIAYAVWNSSEVVFGIIRKGLVAAFKKY